MVHFSTFAVLNIAKPPQCHILAEILQESFEDYGYQINLDIRQLLFVLFASGCSPFIVDAFFHECTTTQKHKGGLSPV